MNTSAVMKKSATPKNVDAYIASCPKSTLPMLRQMRSIIKSAAPKASEKLSYGMPYYAYKGRLAYFRLATHHLGLYIPPPILAEHKNELKGYSWENATLRLPLDKPLPAQLIKKLVKARVQCNEKLYEQKKRKI
jgi:uncharacterized protein YdhG (YjbR/CyaY superfamily)